MSIEDLINEYADYCYRVAYTYVNQHEEVEEIVQDVMWAYYTKQSSFNQQASLKTYLTKITVNKCYDRIRRKKIRKYFSLKDKNVEEVKINPAVEFEKSERNNEILNTVLALPHKYREIIVLYYYEEYRLAEIATILDVSENTVKSRHARAKKRLQDTLRNVYFDEDSWR